MERPKLNSDINLTSEDTLYREIISDMSIPVCCFKPDGSITFKSQSFSDISPSATNFFEIIGEKEIGPLRTNLEKLTPDFPIGSCIHSFIGLNGQTCWYFSKNQAIFTSENQLVEYRYIGHDFNQYHQETEKLRQIGLRDELTGLYNRHFVIEELKRFDSELHPDLGVSFYSREHKAKPYTIIFCDLNDLKKVNDTSPGKHLDGDILLKKTAKIIQKSCRDYDLVARWGGDEFLVLLPETTAQKATFIKDRIFKSCQEKNIGLAMGIAQKEITDSYLQVIDRADKEMYLNKNQMKSKTCYTK